MEAFELSEALATLAASGEPFHEIVRSHDLSIGLYVLPVDGVDHQSPHTEDEAYYVISGRGRVTVGDEDRAVSAGTLVFVAADVPHHFHDIEAELVLLVAFGPAEYTHRVDHDRGHPHTAPRA